MGSGAGRGIGCAAGIHHRVGALDSEAWQRQQKGWADTELGGRSKRGDTRRDRSPPPPALFHTQAHLHHPGGLVICSIPDIAGGR